ncbi:hypothetical protein AAG906_001103 [Vitis piasezkii]
MMMLTLLLRLDFHPDGNHHHKKGMNAPSTLWEETHLTLEKLDGLSLVGNAPTLASFVGNKRTKDVDTFLKSIVSHKWRRLFRHAQSRPTTLRQTIEASYPEGINFSFGSYSRQSKEESSPDRQIRREGRIFRCNVSSIGTLNAKLGGQSHLLETLRAHLGPLAAAPMPERPS